MLTINTVIGKTLPDTKEMREDVQKAKDIEAKIDSLLSPTNDDRFGMIVCTGSHYDKEGK